MSDWRQMNRKKKLKRWVKASTKKPEQIGICRFIDFKDIHHIKVNGRYRNPPEFIKRQGLQIEHNFYYLDNDGTIVLSKINKRGAVILTKYSDIPEWAPQPLLDKYIKTQEKFLKLGILKEYNSDKK